MTMENFLKVLPPMAAPSGAFSGPWEPIEADLGTELPQDYKEFCRLFGVGAVLEFMTIYVPRTRIPYLRLEYQARVVCKALAHDEDLAFPAMARSSGSFADWRDGQWG